MKLKTRLLPRMLTLSALALLSITLPLSAHDKPETAGNGNAPLPPAAEGSTAKFTPELRFVSGLADQALQTMKRRADELKVKGVAVVAYAGGDQVDSWSSKMLVIGNLTNPPSPDKKGDNLLGIAYAKAAEMAATLKDSGSGVRPPLTGEFGWQGGMVSRGQTGILIAAFSGGPSADDVRISQAGLAVLQKDL